MKQRGIVYDVTVEREGNSCGDCVDFLSMIPAIVHFVFISESSWDRDI